MLNPGDGLGLAAAPYPGRVVGVGTVEHGGAVGKVAWTRNMPSVRNGVYQIVDRGPAGGVSATAKGSSRLTVSVANSGTATIVVGDSTHPGAASLNTGGASATGRAAVTLGNSAAVIYFSSASGTWSYEIVFMIPTLSTSGQTFVSFFGFLDTITAANQVDGIYFTIDSDADAQAQCVTSQNSTRTTTDSGVTINAATWYRAKIVLTNDATISFYLKADNGPFTNEAAVATHTTNIPTGSTRALGFGACQLGLVGTNDKAFRYTFQDIRKVPAATASAISSVPVGKLAGMAGGDSAGVPLPGTEGYKLGINDAGILAWVPRFPFDTGAFDWASGVGDTLANVGSEITQQSATGAGAGAALVASRGPSFMMQLSTGTTGTGGNGVAPFTGTIIPTTIFDASSGTWWFFALFKIPTLSTATQKHQVRLGFMDAASAAPGDFVGVLLDSDADAQLQAVSAVGGGSTTTTDTGLTIVADTWYMVAVAVVADDDAYFWCAALDTAMQWDLSTDGIAAALAHHTTNIPSGAGQEVGPCASIVKSVGTTARTLQVTSTLAYHDRRAA